jgi:methionine synthase II (cobalamin-independent)
MILVTPGQERSYYRLSSISTTSTNFFAKYFSYPYQVLRTTNGIVRVLDRFTPEERKDIGIHTCPGGDCDSVHSYDVDYHELLPSMFKMNAGYFLIQLASEKDKEKVYKEIGSNIRKDANGVKQVAFIGVINPLNPKVETPEEVAQDLVTAAKYIPVDQLGATDDCGFSPFSIDAKPKHGSPDFARDVAFQKIKNRIQGAKLASEKLGV